MTQIAPEISADSAAPPVPLAAAPLVPVSQVSGVLCPTCTRPLDENRIGPRALCPACGWTGQAFVFTPLPITVERAEHALPEDATCLHHPSKKATAVCAGTGDYICSLCAIELNGQTYSASYLNSTGKEKVGQAFERYLPRPDVQVVMFMVLCFVPYVNFLLIPTAFIWIPWSFVLYAKALKLRQTNPLFARVMGRGRVILIPIFLSLFALGWLIGVIVMIYSLSSVH